MTFTAEELEEMRIADEEIERDFAHGRIKADPLAEKFANPERFAHAARCRKYCEKNREKINAYQREHRAKNKEAYNEKQRLYRQGYRQRIKEMYQIKGKGA